MSRYQPLGGYGPGQGPDDQQHNPYMRPTPPPQHAGYYRDQSPSPAPHAPSQYQPHPGQVASPFQDPVQHPASPFHDHAASPPPMAQHSYYTTPSPGPPAGHPHVHDYEMEPMDYNRPAPGQPLPIPMGPGPQGGPADQLAMQPTWEIEDHPNSYGHHESYEAAHPAAAHGFPQRQQSATGDIALHPDEHHDAYYNDPYEPHPSEDPAHPYGHGGGYHDESDARPMLQSGDSYGPDSTAVPTPMEESVDEPLMPQRQTTLKRWKTVKAVQLFEGNLVLDCPVPPRLLNQVDHTPPPGRDEYTHMRYSAVTGDPNDFHQNRFRLRQQLFAKPRHTELFICVTMYNEEDELFARTMIGIIKNIEYMNSRTSSKTWGKEAWKKIVVCVVSDGRAKINPRTRAVLAALGCYQEGIAKQKVNDKDVTAHVYEYTTQMSLDIKKGVVSVKKGQTPIQMIFCLKEKNQKKINSHRWFFQAFGGVLNPNICVLIDAGTRPGKDSIYHLWKAFDIQPHCAGACGEIKAMLEYGKQLLNPLVAAQNFEYKISNILDKPVESVFGFITVLPGAFSAYRYVALQNDKTGQGPLEKYFKGEKMHGANAGIFTANMYLAEDRILCFELVAKRNCRWVLQYVKSAEGATDVPTEMSDFILQRRRWLNGSFFAAVYSTAHFYQIFRSSHSCIRKFFFLFEFLYQVINQLFAWFAIGNFFLVFRILTVSLSDPNLLDKAGLALSVVFEWLYLVTLISCFVLALGNRPQGSNKLYMTMVYFWVILMAYLMFAAVFVVVKSIQQTIAKNGGHFTVQLLFGDRIFATLIVSLLATYVLYFTMSFLFLDPWHMFTSFIQYLLLTPSYINILNVYAFCNTHDITWGTKGDTKPEPLGKVNVSDGKADVSVPDNETDLNTQYETELQVFSKKLVVEKKKPSEADKQEDYYKGFRSAVVLLWIFCNLALAGAVLNIGGFERIPGGGGTTGTPARRRQAAQPGTQPSAQPDDQEIIRNHQLIYMQVVLYSVAALSLVRWIGSLWFLVLRLLRGV